MADVDLILNNEATPLTVIAGQEAGYVVRVENGAGASETATATTVTHTVSSNAIYRGFVDMTGHGVVCGGMSLNQTGGGTLTCTLPPVAPDVQLSYRIALGSTVSGTLALGARINVNPAQVDPELADNEVNASTTVTAGADLSISVAPASTTLSSGSSFWWALTVGNAGPDAATNLVVTLPLPAGVHVPSAPPGCAIGAGVVTCQVAGPIASGGSLAVATVTGQVTAAGGSTVTGSASVQVSAAAPVGTPKDPNTGNNTVTASITVAPGSDVTLTKSRSVPGSLIVGQSFNFVLAPSFSGGLPGTVTVTDAIPANYTLGVVPSPQNGWVCGSAGQVVTCSKTASGAPGLDQALGNISIPVTATTAGPSVTNTASVSSTAVDPNPANNTATDGGVPLLEPTVDLGLTKTGPRPALVVQDTPFVYEVAASNGGNAPYHGTFSVVDSVPTGLTVQSYTLNGWACLPAAPVAGPADITCSRTYTAGAPLGASATTPAVVLNAVANRTGNINNSATIRASSCNLGAGNCGDGDLASYVVTSSIESDSADLQMVKAVVGPDPLAAGEVLTYTLEVVNAGPSPASTVSLVDAFETLISNSVGANGAGYVGHSLAAGLATGGVCGSVASGGTGRELTCTFTEVPVCVQGSGNCPTVTVQVRPGGNGGVRVNTAQVVSNGTADPVLTNNADSVSSAITARADVTVNKTANPSPIAAGQNLTYIVTATNQANNLSAAEGVTISDTLPADVTFLSATPSSGACSVMPAANSVTGPGNNTVSCNLGTINNGSQQTVTIVVRPNTGTRGTLLTNNVTVFTTTPETDATNNTASVVASVVNPSLDLLLSKIDTPDPVAVGDNMTYTVTVTNTGPSAASNVVMTDPLPTTGLMTFVSATAAGGTCTAPAVGAAGGTVSCNLGYMPANTTRTVAITMRAVTKGVYTNTASVTSAEAAFDTNAANNAATQPTTVRTKADMQAVSKTASVASTNLREPFTYSILVRNNAGVGLGEADGVVLTDPLPTGMELTGTPTVLVTAGTVSTPTCGGAAGDVSFSCTLGTVSSGAAFTITVPVQLVAVTSNPQTFINSVSVSTTSLDTVPGNNTTSGGNVSVASSSVAGRVFRDFNNDGLVTLNDTGISGVTMTLTGQARDGAAISRTMTTDSTGNYAFTGVPEGVYTVRQGTVSEAHLVDGQDSVGMVRGVTSGSAAVNDEISAIVLPANTEATAYNFAEVPTARLGVAKSVSAGPTVNADGSFTATFTLEVRNFSLEALTEIDVTDVLSGGAPKFGTVVMGVAPSSGQYRILSAGQSGGAELNTSFNGDSDPRLATIRTLAPGARTTFSLQVRVRPTTPLPAVGTCGGLYCNQASATGTGSLSGQTPTDLSNNGSNPDTNNNGIPNESSDNVVTPVSPVYAPALTLVKSMSPAATVQADGSILVPVRLVVTNSGDEPLSTVSVTDPLSTLAGGPFGTAVAGGAAASLANGQYTLHTAPALSGACTNGTATAGFTGHTGNLQVLAISSMAPAASCTVDFSYRFMPQAGTAYVNEAAVSGTSDYTNTPADAVGSLPVPYPRVGVAKQLASAAVTQADGTVVVPFSVLVRNLGGEVLSSVTVSDSLAGAAPKFGTHKAGGAAAVLEAGEYTLQTAPAWVGACAGGATNAAFTGDAATSLGTITNLAVGGSCTVTFGVRFRPASPAPAVSATCGERYCNQASASATGASSGLTTTDLSDNGTNPDANNNGIANETGENDPTPVPFTLTPLVGLAKSMPALEVINPDGSIVASFRVRVQNHGTDPLLNVTVSDTLSGAAPRFGTHVPGGAAATLADGQYTVHTAPALFGACAAATLTPGFNGSAAAELASLTRLNIGESCELDFAIRFKPVSPLPVSGYANQANASATGEFSDTPVTDLSQNGTNPDANGNGDPTDDNTPTPVAASYVASVGLSKAVGSVIQTGVKRYRIPYSLIVENVGTAGTATNVQVTDNLNTAFPTAQTRVISTPAAVSACSGTLLAVASPAFTGVGQNQLLMGNQSLQPGERCTITFTVEIDFGANPLPSVVQNNQANVTASLTPGGTVIASDLSHNGLVPDPNGNHLANDAGEDDPTPVSFAAAGLAAVTGKVYLDSNHDRLDNDGPSAPQVEGFEVEVLNSAGQLVGSAVTAADGTYTVSGLFPSTVGDPATNYTVQFREPASGALYGLSQSTDPNPARNGVVADGKITQLPLAAGVTTLNQNLPLDPAGVVYDAVTRNPVAGASVALTSGGAPVPGSCLVGGVNPQVTGASGMYQFLLLNPPPAGCPGNATYGLEVTQPGGYLPPASVMIPPTAGSHVPPVGGVDAIQAQSGPPTGAQPTTYYFSFDLTLGVSADVVNNHIPLDPILGGAIAMTKTTPMVNVMRSDLVPYTVTATNTLAAALNNINVVDVIPAGFRYRIGSASLNGVPLEPLVSGRSLTWPDLLFAANERKTWRMLLVVGSGVAEGNHVNQVAARNSVANAQVSNTAEATVRVVPDPTFDCADIIGKVFDDKNANGYQDQGEPGLANVRMATARGLLVTSDAQGRFHVACAAIPNADRGSNFVMKLDERTLPSGYRVTTENPRDVRVTRGKMVKLNFGATVHRVVRLDVSGEAFADQGLALKPAHAQALPTLLTQLAQRPSVLRIAYRGSGPEDLAEQRVEDLTQRIRALWEARRTQKNEDSEPLHPLLIETELEVTP